MFGQFRGRPRPPVARRQRPPTLPKSEATMRCVSYALLRTTLTMVLASGGWYAGAAAQDPRAVLDPITSAVMKHPITTSSTVARDHFLRGQRELDLARFIDANAHFKEAVAADPTFAFAYLNVANTANSLDEFKTNLALAEQHAAGASDAERLQIQMVRKGFDNDLVGQLALGQQLVEKHPDSPRAWLALAGVQGALNRNEAARTSIAKALELMQRAEALAPNEAGAHTSLGDVYRAQRNLAKAREEYMRGHQLDPRDGILLVKAGHANTFLGDYVAARADYDSAIAVGRANQKAGYAPFRAYVSVYAGDPAAAIDELNRLVASIDGMGVPDPKTAKVGALTSVVVIATHTRNRAAVEQALQELEPLLTQQADEAENPAFRRGQQATIAYFEGWWAARRGDYAAAQKQADQIGQLLAPDANPRKLEPMHQLEGFIALYQGKYREAAGHLRLGNTLDPYVKYQLAVATEGAGDATEAKRLFADVAQFNFNTVGFALVRKDAQQKAGAGTL